MTFHFGVTGRRVRQGALVAFAAGLVAFGPTAGVGTAAQSTPVIPPPPAEAPPGATVPAGEPAAATVGPLEMQTIAQGLVEVEGTAVWRVRQVASATEAEGAAGAGFSFTLQREGASVVEDEESDRGALLQTGEAVFVAADGSDTRRASGTDPSTVWVIELVAPNARVGDGLSSGTVLFTSDLIDDYPAERVEAELRRGVLGGGERAQLPDQTGPALVIVTDGTLEVAAGDAAPSSLNAGASVLMPEAPTVTNPGGEPAGFVVATIGEEVSAASAPAPAVPAGTPRAAAQSAAAATEPATIPAAEQGASADEAPETTTTPAAAVVPTAEDTDGDGLGDEDEAIYGSDPLNKDFDADGLLDGEEVNIYGTDPVNNDTDADTLLDGDEVNQFGSNPASSDGDGDLIGDASEIYETGTSPSNFDSDGDGASDGDEVAAGTDPNDATSAP